MIKKGVTDAFEKYTVPDLRSVSSAITPLTNAICFESLKHTKLHEEFQSIFLDGRNVFCWNDILCSKDSNNVINIPGRLLP